MSNYRGLLITADRSKNKYCNQFWNNQFTC